jgi:riboflavin synthase
VFTGIITEVGTVADIKPVGGGLRLSIEGERTALGMKLGDSIAVNGVCQTVVSLSGSIFDVEAVEETLSKTTLGSLVPGRRVNLESPLRVGDQLGGHFVQGHVDGVGTIRSVAPLSSSTLLDVEIPATLSRYVIPIGSIALDGISLTIAALKGSVVVVSIIPHTFKNTTLGEVAPGTRVNVECDMLGKYASKLAGEGSSNQPGRISEELLRQWGYEP